MVSSEGVVGCVVLKMLKMFYLITYNAAVHMCGPICQVGVVTGTMGETLGQIGPLVGGQIKA